MPDVGVDKLVVERDVPPLKEEVESLIAKAKEYQEKYGDSKPPRGVYQRSEDVEFVDVGSMYCEFGVVGAWNVAAKCEVVSDDGRTLAWMGWIMDYVPRGSDVGTFPPLKFSFCYSPELYKRKKLYIYDEEIGSVLEEKLKNTTKDYVCVEGWADDPEYFVARGLEQMKEIGEKIEKKLEELEI